MPSKDDTSLFYFCENGHTIYMLVYVDVVIVASSSEELTKALLQYLEKGFAIKGLGHFTTFLV